MINPFEYIKSIQGQWAWAKYCKAFWIKADKKWLFKWELSTGGLSDHEYIIDKMQEDAFWKVCWQMSRRGGHNVFLVDPKQWGYKLVNEYAKEKGVSRQSIYNYPHKYEWINVSHGVKFIKLIPPK